MIASDCQLSESERLSAALQEKTHASARYRLQVSVVNCL